MPHQTKSQILIATIIILMATLGIGAVVLLFSRSVRETTQQQLDLEKAYSLAESGLKVGVRCAKNDPLDCSLYNQTSNVTLGGGNYNLTLVQNAQNVGVGRTFIKVDITSKGQYGKSTYILTDSLQMLTTPPITWAKTYQMSSLFLGEWGDYLYWLQQTNDGGYILGGSTFPVADEDFCLIKINATGGKEWSKYYGSGNIEGCRAGQQTRDGGYILGGFYGPILPTIPKQSFLMIKTDANGTRTWATRIRDSGRTYTTLESVIQTNDTGYIAAGFTGEYSEIGTKDLDFFVVKTGSTGVINWTKAWGGNGTQDTDALRTVREVPGGYIFLGESNHYSNNPGNNADFNLIFTNTTGDWKWAKYYGGTGNETPGASVERTSDGGYIFGGVSDSASLNITGESGVLLIKTDPNGNLTWAKTYDAHCRDELRSIKETSDGGFILKGDTGSFNSPICAEAHVDFFLIKTDNQGNIGWNKIYNNPYLGRTTMDELSSFEITQLHIFDYGRGALQETAYGYVLGGYTVDIDQPLNPLPDWFVVKTDKTGSIQNCAVDSGMGNITVNNVTGLLLVGNITLENINTTITSGFYNSTYPGSDTTVANDRSPCP